MLLLFFAETTHRSMQFNMKSGLCKGAKDGQPNNLKWIALQLSGGDKDADATTIKY